MNRIAIPKKIKDFVLIASKHQCSVCQAHTVDVHHIIAVSEGGTNDLDNLMIVCPNHHREFHDGKLSIEQMRSYKTQWLQKCKVFFEVGIPTEKLVKDRIVASELPFETKIQFIQETVNCIIETTYVDNENLYIFYKSGASITSEFTRQIIIMIQIVYRLFKDVKIITCTFPSNSQKQILLGLDLPEILSFTVKMKDIDKFVFGKISIEGFWNTIKFFKKRGDEVTNREKIELDVPWMI